MKNNPHHEIIINCKATLRRPYYMVFYVLIAFIGFIHSSYIFYKSYNLIPITQYIPSTASDTAVVSVPTNLPILPAQNQELYPGSTLSESETIAEIKDYLPIALKECFTMNYINFSNVLAKCKSHHLDTESDTQDSFITMLNDNNYLPILKRYKTAASLSVDEPSIKLVNQGTVQMEVPGGLRTRFIWIFRLNMRYSMESVSITSPEHWEVEIIRESAFTKEFPVSIFKIRDVE